MQSRLMRHNIPSYKYLQHCHSKVAWSQVTLLVLSEFLLEMLQRDGALEQCLLQQLQSQCHRFIIISRRSTDFVRKAPTPLETALSDYPLFYSCDPELCRKLNYLLPPPIRKHPSQTSCTHVAGKLDFPHVEKY